MTSVCGLVRGAWQEVITLNICSVPDTVPFPFMHFLHLQASDDFLLVINLFLLIAIR